jgi:PAS domain S-box-containing protein
MAKTTILIVENEAIVAADLAGKLRQLGYEVAGMAAEGQEAVALATRLCPHLVLMDIRLEGPMDGIEAAERIRLKNDVPVIYLTAHSDPATLARAKVTGPFGYILKPFDERELATQIELALYKHRADREIREQREWLRVTLTSIGDAVIATDGAGRITFINPVAESLAGWKAEEGVGQPVTQVFRVVNEQTGQPLEEPVARVLREGRSVPLANHAALVTRDGRTVPVEDTASPILDATGKVIGVVLVFHDVTEKRRSEEALREAERKYRELFRYAPTAIYEIDFREKRFTSVNDAMCYLVGYSREELLAMNPFDLLDEEGQVRFHARITQWLNGKEPDENVEYKVRAKDGHPLDVILSVTFTTDETGKPLGATVVGHDITERKQMEHELRRSRDGLELRVRERTAELETYMKRLQESNQALQDFASIASHDMQEPLRKVASFGKLLKEGYADALGTEGEDFLDRMLNATDRMQTLLKSLLDYSRITTRVEPFREVELATIVREVLSDLEVKIRETEGEVRVRELPTIEADPVQMRQLFQNIIGNALKFKKAGEKPFVEMRGRSLGNGITEIVVTDNGIGFDEKYLGRIFAPFQRLHGRSDYEGTGMGLAICRKIVERHGGRITAKSDPGNGAVFMIEMPLKKTSQARS